MTSSVLYETRRPDPDKYRDIHVPLHYRLLFQEEGTYQKKLYVKTFPFPSTNRGHQRYIGRKIQLKRPLSFAKGVLCPSPSCFIYSLNIYCVQIHLGKFSKGFVYILQDLPQQPRLSELQRPPPQPPKHLERQRLWLRPLGPQQLLRQRRHQQQLRPLWAWEVKTRWGPLPLLESHHQVFR